MLWFSMLCAVVAGLLELGCRRATNRDIRAAAGAMQIVCFVLCSIGLALWSFTLISQPG